MDTALKAMFPSGQISQLQFASLKDSRLCHGKVRESAGTFVDGILSGRIQTRYETAAKTCDLREGMRFSPLVHDTEKRSFSHSHGVRFKVPRRVRCSAGSLCE